MPRDRALLDWLRIDRNGSVPLQQQLGDQLRAAIDEGRLPPGTPLPSSRNLAADLSIARGTAIAVYDRLLGEGLLQVRDRSAIFVSDAAGQGEVAGIGDEEASEAGDEAAQGKDRWHRQVAFLPGVPAFDIFPAARWARILGARALQMSFDLVADGLHEGGYPPLQAALAAHLRTARGVLCEPEQVIITGSGRAATTMLCRLLGRPGDRCLVEDPGYMVTRRIVAGCGLEPVPIPVDANGMRVESPVPKARLAFLTPTHQMPLGVVLADYRGALLLEWARREDAWIVEDDYDSEFRYVGQPVVALQHSDPNGRVIYLGTFSKTLFPGLRIAFLVVPQELARPAAVATYQNGQAPTIHIQAALADFIAQGHYAAQIRRARRVYRRRQGLLVAALNHHLEGIVTVSQPAGGMNLVLPFPADIPALSVQALAARETLHVRAISYYTEGSTAPNAAHLGFAAVPERLIEPSVERLGRVIRSLRD